MRDFFDLLKELFMFNKADNLYVGLSSFKKPAVPVQEVVDSSAKNTKEVKISDLMRRAEA